MGIYQLQLAVRLGDVVVHRVYEERIEARTDTDAIALAHHSMQQAPVWERSNYAVLLNERQETVWSKATTDNEAADLLTMGKDALAKTEP